MARNTYTDEQRSAFAKKITDRMAACGITVDMIAQRMEITRQQAVSYMRGTIPDAHNRARLAAILKCRITGNLGVNALSEEKNSMPVVEEVARLSHDSETGTFTLKTSTMSFAGAFPEVQRVIAAVYPHRQVLIET